MKIDMGEWESYGGKFLAIDKVTGVILNSAATLEDLILLMGDKDYFTCKVPSVADFQKANQLSSLIDEAKRIKQENAAKAVLDALENKKKEVIKEHERGFLLASIMQLFHEFEGINRITVEAYNSRYPYAFAMTCGGSSVGYTICTCSPPEWVSTGCDDSGHWVCKISFLTNTKFVKDVTNEEFREWFASRMAPFI